MQIRTSIKAVFVITCIVSCLIMSRVFFVLIFDYYKEGVSTITRMFLMDVAKQNTTGDDYFGGVYIRSNWQDFPKEFRTDIRLAPTESGQLVKTLEERQLFSSPRKINYILFTENALGEPIYVGKKLNWEETGVMVGQLNLMIYWRAFLLSIFFAALFTALLLFVLRAIVAPLESLKTWAKSLSDNINDDDQPVQVQFRYREFKDIADIISQSIEQKKESLRKEKEFLQFSSHELRTPLAVIKSNNDLLKKITAEQTGAITRVVTRIDNATNTMTRLVDTFLWLSRNDNYRLELEDIDLEALIKKLVSELNYLVINKPVELVLQTASSQIRLPAMPCRIILNNLISNAFQHASGGSILIYQSGSTIRISNEDNSIQSNESNNTGFGLGLRLVEKIADRYGWHVDVVRTREFYIVEVKL